MMKFVKIIVEMMVCVMIVLLLRVWVVVVVSGLVVAEMCCSADPASAA